MLYTGGHHRALLPNPIMRPDITIYFIRHGETDWNAAGRYQGQMDIPLNHKGRGQAARNGAVLRDLLADPSRLDFVSSPLGRARETMDIVRDKLGLAAGGYRCEPRLKEVHYGVWEGTLWNELPTVDPEGLAARKKDPFHWRPREGESYADLDARTGAWLAGVERNTVVTSHGGVSRTLRGRVLGLDVREVPFLEVPQDRILMLRRGSIEWA